MLQRVTFLYAIVISAAFCGTSSGQAQQAKDVTLTLRSGGLAITGELMASDAGSYVIKSAKYGVMAVETSKFECSGPLCPRPAVTTIGIHGSNTIGAQLMPNTIERFAEQESLTAEKVVGNDAEEVLYKLTGNDGKDVAAIDLRSHGTGTAPPSLAQGKAQIGEMSRPMNAAEMKSIADAGLKLKTHVYALDGLLVFVHPQNPIKALSLEQIAKIFAGEIKDWAQVGGKPGKINVYARDNKSGTFDTFDSLVLKPQKLKISPEAKRFESSPDLSDETARDPNGIGFAGFAYKRSARPIAISSACGITSAPEVFTVKTEEYPLARRLYLYTTSAPIHPVAQKLLDFALSEKAQDAITEASFIDQRIEMQTFDSQTPRFTPALLVPDKEFSFPYMRQLVNELKDARRLSINFRFQKNSALLDDKAAQDIPRLARFLKSGAIKPAQVMLVGFTDNAGTFEVNRVVSNSRAIGIKNALVAEGVSAGLLTVHAYGNLLPVGCNTTDAGKDSNRRVEVWIKE